jgi:signal transduction histidine kinase
MRVLACLLLLNLFLAGCAQSVRKDVPSPVELDEGWEHRWGDSPLDTSGVPVWAYDRGSDGEWQPFDITERLPEGEGEYIWCRVRLPAGEWRDPALACAVYLPFEIYLEDRLVFSSGDVGPSPGAKFQGLRHYVAPIPHDFQGRALTLRIYWGKRHYYSPRVRISLGSNADQVQGMISSGLDQVILGFLLVIIGLFGLYTFLRGQGRIALSFGLLSVCVGLYTMSGASTRPFLPDAPALWWYVFYIGLYFFPVGMWSFFELVFAPSGGRFFRRLWQLHLIYGLLFLLLDIAGVMPFYSGIQPMMLMLIGGMIGLFVTLLRTASVAGPEIKILAFGSVVVMLFGLHDILVGFQLLPWDLFVFHWGLFLFVLLLAFLLERRFAEAHKSLRISKERLEEYSHTLEDRVAERTRDLSQKNDQLEDALSELKETQNQLVMREKMASLGNLVAGVAHEVNSPVGAVNSAADVSSRCISRMNSVLEESPLCEEVAENRPFQQAMTLLKENTRLIVTAGERIATIVKSLRNFARLDEAEFQSADLHEGLDSTLTLVHHELKNRAEVIRDYGEIPLVECFPNQLNQVFMNLLVNAAQAIEGKGTVTIRTSADAEKVYVEIADTGKGISSEHLGRIFDPGFTTKGVGVGVGLGLSISYNIVQKHHGEIDVESEPGKGTSFTLSLPILAASAGDEERD